jgi:2-oxoglutarate dehydrogenase E1 component
LNEAYQKSKNITFETEEWSSTQWDAIKDPKKYGAHKDTGVDIETLRDIGSKISVLPADKKFHPQIVKIFKAREKAIADGVNIDWGTAEALAFATLIKNGKHVRLSGQDVARGTFSHRHAHVWYQDEDGHYVPVNAATQNGENVRNFIASNSHLSEYAVLGFEFGYA